MPQVHEPIEIHAARMARRQFKNGIFVLLTLNIYGTCYYFNYLFFHLRDQFAYSDRDNLWFAASCGLLYTFLSWLGGKFAQRRGYFTALYLGCGTVTAALVAAGFLHTASGQLVAMLVWTAGICFTWAPLEALASDGESPRELPRLIGLYNVVWAAGAAVAYFTGGAVLKALGPESLFWLPALLHGAQLVLIWRLRRVSPRPAPQDATSRSDVVEAEHSRPPSTGQFLRLAWLANPFAYVAMSTIIPLIPGLASHQGLTQAQAGFVASVWMFARLAAFAVLWRWAGWHYHLAWLLGSYAAMTVSFAALLLAGNLAVIVLAQLVFGFAVGLIYYSSLFYSMDAGDRKGEHGGIHEALIGLGIFGGPAVGGLALYVGPGTPNVGVWAVSALLAVGFGALLLLARPARLSMAPATGPSDAIRQRGRT